MKNLPGILLLIILFAIQSCNTNPQALDQLIEENLSFAIEQSKLLDASVAPELLPRSTDMETGELITSDSRWWCSGFFPGILWYLYNYSGDEELMKMAMKRTMLIEKEQYYTGTHDLGFMINNSFGLGHKIAGVEGYKEVMVNGAYSLLSRYNPKVACIRSWDHGKWTFPVIIDNMMNLEFLTWAFRETGDSAFLKATLTHTETTIDNHFRDDYSSYHVVDYDTITGEVLKRQTAQGYADESAWARGQAWGLYGFVSVFRETGEKRYLEQAIGIADFLLCHPNLPEDKIPYWDFNAPNIPDAKRDASAGTIICSALIELQHYVKKEKSERYRIAAETMLRSLASSDYRAEPGENGNFILMHSVGNIPANSEVDVPLTYADYYFVEALLRMKELISME